MGRLISVIVPCYNAEKTIERCICSLSRQDYKEIEIIAINDGSSDDTYRILQRCCEKEDRLIIINQTNAGVSAARNIGMQAARGEYYSFVDADDFVEPDYLSKLATYINGADISLCYYSSALTDIKHSQNYESVNNLFREMMVPQENIAAFVWNRLYRASIIQENELNFDESVFTCEDTLFNYRYMQYVSRVGICREYLYHYIINNCSAMFGLSFNRKKITANIAYEYMLNDSSGKSYRKWVEVAAMWFNLIMKRQIYNSSYKPTTEEITSINRMLGLNVKAFMSAPIPAKFKIAYPIWKMR